jgi:phycocyanobilin:ferredoxin oxidoreductase
VETLTLKDRISVLHVCIFPHFDDPSPIFGYDIIAGASKVTGIFLDLTGSLDQIPTPRLRDAIVSFGNIKFAQKRELPEWGMIFSPDIIAIRPVSDAELRISTEVALHALGLLLTAPRERDGSLAEEIKAGQRQYADAQRRNQHTFRMLSNIFGKECAVHFIENILFPLS